MKYKRGTNSGDLVDARGRSGGRRQKRGGGLGGLGGGSVGRGARIPSGSGGGMPLGKGCAGGGSMGLIIVVGLMFLLFKGCSGGGGGGFGELGTDDGGLGGLGRTGVPSGQFEELDSPIPSEDNDAELKDFMAFLIADINDFWQGEMAASNIDYARPKLVIFEDELASGCGTADSRMGPHYCTLDQQIYLDFDFFRELAGPKFEAGGDFAQAYVIAHEVGHHIQNQLGINEEVRRTSTRSNQNELSIRLELQADCLAGVWAHSADERGMLEPGDVEEGLKAAESVGDDSIQTKAQGRVNPEAWTHGSAADRQEWLGRGLRNGDPNECDTFSVGGEFSDNV